jgi:hypothetical protein
VVAGDDPVDGWFADEPAANNDGGDLRRMPHGGQNGTPANET